MPALLNHVDPDGLLEYSVVYTDRALNHMAQRFQRVMQQVSATLKQVYGARSAIVVPGSGSFGMEAVARQFAQGKKVLVIRNGWFSYRWSQIFDTGAIPAATTVLKARRLAASGPTAPFLPAPIDEVVAAIRREQPDVVFAPHVETSAGMILPDDYLRAVAEAVHAHGGLFVLDCVASGAMWVDMRATGVDILVSAPQKGWSSTPCAGLVMLGDEARARIDATTSSSFSMDLKKWLSIMETHEKGQIAYHATLPTDGLVQLRDAMQETAAFGFVDAVDAIDLPRDLERRSVVEADLHGQVAMGLVRVRSAVRHAERNFEMGGRGLAAAVVLRLASEPVGQGIEEDLLLRAPEQNQTRGRTFDPLLQTLVAQLQKARPLFVGVSDRQKPGVAPLAQK